jgi:hypothetical protein
MELSFALASSTSLLRVLRCSSSRSCWSHSAWYVSCLCFCWDLLNFCWSICFWRSSLHAQERTYSQSMCVCVCVCRFPSRYHLHTSQYGFGWATYLLQLTCLITTCLSLHTLPSTDWRPAKNDQKLVPLHVICYWSGMSHVSHMTSLFSLSHTCIHTHSYMCIIVANCPWLCRTVPEMPLCSLLSLKLLLMSCKITRGKEGIVSH